MKKVYIKPALERVDFLAVDVICTSVEESLEEFLRGNLAEDYGKQVADIFKNI